LIDSYTAQAHADSETLPHILQGIPLRIRSIRVSIDRPDFTFNPTSCESMTIGGAIIGGGADFNAPGDDTVKPVSDRFQVGNCATLAFKPLFAASTSGKTSRADGASLHVKLAYPNAAQGTQANIKSVRVELPRALPSRLSTLNHACTDAVFNSNPAGCPSQSRVGYAKAITPVLPVALEGPAYFVSHGGEKFPELIMVLQGYGVTIDLAGETFISKAGITSSTFKQVPDVPVSAFELTLPEGPFSALAANTDLCATSLAMPTDFQAQNGASLRQSTPIEVDGCSYSLGIRSHTIAHRTLTLKVVVPAAGNLSARGRGLSSRSKASSSRTTLTLKIAETHGGALRTKLLLAFTPSHGRQRKVLRKSLTVRFP
jgi:hypothetical protein